MNESITAPVSGQIVAGPTGAAGFPTQRLRRNRRSPALRSMLRETVLTVDDLIYPLFVTHGQDVQREISSMPGVFQWSVDRLRREVEDDCPPGHPGDRAVRHSC